MYKRYILDPAEPIIVPTPQYQNSDAEPLSTPSRARGTNAGRSDAGGRLRRGDRTRSRILDAAEETFGKHGFHGASIVEITRSAGVGLGTFYVYFPSKLDIYRQLLRSYLEDFVRVAREATSGAGDYREIVRGAFKAFFDWIGARPGVLRLLREAEFVDPTLLAELYKAPAEEYRSRLERAMKAGYIAPIDPDVLAWCIMGMTEFAVMRWLIWPEQERMDPERFDAYVEVIVRALGLEQKPSVT